MKVKENLILGKFIRFVGSGNFILLVSFLSLSVFSSLVFYFLRNWDMVVRILDARHMFSGGYYYEPMRAIFESLIIGLFSFISSTYSVYFFIFFVSAVFLVSVFYLSKAMKLNFAVLFMFLLSPFVLFYGIKNGSDLLVISFLILYVAAIIREKPVFAGLFITLAFLSKSYALIFFPLLLFLIWGKNIKQGLFSFLISIATAVAALIPYLVYNLIEYGNLLYPIGMSYLYFHIFSSYVSLSLSVSHFESMPLIGFEETVLPFLILLFFYWRDKKYFSSRLKKNKRQYSIITSACILSFLVFFSVSNLIAGTGLSVFRFMLPLSVFLYILSFSFFKNEDSKFVYVLFIASLVIAVFIFEQAVPITFHMSYAKQAVALFGSVYSGKCTVASNEWVYLDYLGLNAVSYQPYPNYSGAILNFGKFNTTLPLIKNQGNIYLYGLKTCTYYPSIQYSRFYFVVHEENIPNNACYWLFGINPKIPTIFSLCNSTNNIISGIFNNVK